MKKPLTLIMLMLFIGCSPDVPTRPTPDEEQPDSIPVKDWEEGADKDFDITGKPV